MRSRLVARVGSLSALLALLAVVALLPAQARGQVWTPKYGQGSWTRTSTTPPSVQTPRNNTWAPVPGQVGHWLPTYGSGSWYTPFGYPGSPDQAAWSQGSSAAFRPMRSFGVRRARMWHWRGR
jgi:hypothetical protein